MFYDSNPPWRRHDLFFLIHEINIKSMYLYVGSSLCAELKYTVFQFIEMETSKFELYLLPSKK